MKRALIPFALLTILLAGCAVVPPEFKHDEQGKFISKPTEGKATLVIIREVMLLGAVGAWPLSIDGREISRLAPGSYVVKDVVPGEHWISGPYATPRLVKCEAGKSYFYNYDISTVADFNELPEDSARSMTEKYVRVRTLY